ncbi:hypothetical protein INT43_001577 [Umbelopsis isabellina]|uniref:Uncharacterized protein n=1 Tax=Mortierella isabellina TaxID=91625 RepID=A0A8H7U7T3_MORIS|nr:hypothetical protein INT43_001577 [Umbelopsis isabellina]
MNTDQFNSNTNTQNTGFDQQQNTGFDQQQNTGFDQQQNTGFDQQQSTGLSGQQSTGFDQQQNVGGMNSGFDQQQGGISDAGNAYSSGGMGGMDTSQTQTTSGDYPISSQDPGMTQSSATDPMSQGGLNTTAAGQDTTQTQDNSWGDSNTQGNIQSSNDPLNASDNNQSFGDNQQNIGGQNLDQYGNPSTGDKIKGTMKKMAGKLQNDPSKVAEGEQLKQGGDSNLM